MEIFRSIRSLVIVAVLAAIVGYFIGSRVHDAGSRNGVVSSDKPAMGLESPASSARAKSDFAVDKVSARGSGDASSAVQPSNGKTCDPTITLQEQMARMKFVELTRLCEEAEQDWRKRNLETRAPGPKDTVESDKFRKDILESLRGSLLNTTYFRGETSFTIGERNIQLEVFLNFYDGTDAAEMQFKRTSLNVIDPMDLCYGISPVFVVNGKLSAQSTSSTSTCGATLHKRGDRYYISWGTVSDKDISAAVSLVLIPLPGPASGGLEYLISDTGQWITQDGFHWSPSTNQESQNLLTRYQKKMEEQAH